jgi:uncharacterized membrane protein
MAASSPKQAMLNIWAARITRWLTRFLHVLSRHWLLLANLAIGLYAGLPILAPVLMHSGHTRLGALLYLVYRPLCHQLPERSFFLFGQQWVYSLAQIQARTGLELVPLRYVGAPGLGFKVAVCERCSAVYGMMLVFGLAFGLVRGKLRPLPLRWFAVLIAPMAVDGFGQLLGFWTSTWLTRLITGALFALGAVWLTFPYLQSGMSEIQHSTGKPPQESP